MCIGATEFGPKKEEKDSHRSRKDSLRGDNLEQVQQHFDYEKFEDYMTGRRNVEQNIYLNCKS